MSSSSSSSSLKEQAISAKLLLKDFMGHRNLSLLTAEHLSPLYAKMFPNVFTCILNGAMKPASKSSVVEYMMEGSFSFVNDGTSDIAVKKMNALCALIFDVNNSKRVEFKFYDTCATSGEHCSKASAYFSL